jgi:esterase/lipase
MDLMNLKPTSDTVEVTITHPNTGDVLKNDDKTPMTITVYASHAKEHKAVLHEQTNKRLKAMQSGKKQDFTAQDIEEATLTLLSKITAEWNITYGGENPKLSVAKAKEIYDEVFWIKAQVEEALADSLDFTKA